MKPLCLLLFVFCLGGHLPAAVLTTARETKASTTLVDGKYLHERTVEVVVGLSEEELSKKPMVEVFYIEMDSPDKFEVGYTGYYIRTLNFTQAVVVRPEGPRNMKDVWAARITLDGKAVAWKGENAAALKWIKALNPRR
ncbi:hypothetical protein [Rariglobus hedericola]|uniref:Uncharacterized protein n=1 Tax=Rariglobus hedericola TaxID=2597822 RepID=A0A556QLJ4_9BACT|nr:hypothetical protein [Rariglobus hedericola]TSJ77504.1 hypothetical protein FPL22_15570 [Rariglobus hedericola]